MTTYTIELALASPQALLDGSAPQLLADDALPDVTAQFLEARFRRAPQRDPWVLALHLEPGQGQAAERDTAALQRAIATHYAARVAQTHDEIRDYRHDLLRAFIYGGIFLGTCLGLHQLLETALGEHFPRLFDEGLIIIGWVALWRPAELLTYSWVPLRRRLKLQRKLVTVQVRAAGAP